MQNPTVVLNPGIPIGPEPCKITCPSCKASITTKMVTTNTSKTHLFAFLLCIFGCWPCVCVPYCMNSCKNANHSCPNCDAFIGTYKA